MRDNRAGARAPAERCTLRGGKATTIDSLPVILLGFLLGMRHATDADHVIAVATIVGRARTTRSAALIGTLWGVGHTVTIMLVGSLIVAFGLVIPPRVGLAMEFAVALMLIALGLASVFGVIGRVSALAASERAHPHSHDDDLAGSSGAATVTRLPAARGLAGLGLYHALRPLVVGLVHGLAGSAAVALLVLATIRDPFWAIGYLLLFGVGTIAGMMLITMVIAVPFSYSAARFAVVNRYLGLAAGVLSLGVGLVLAYQIGFVEGLFSASPRWTPQ